VTFAELDGLICTATCALAFLALVVGFVLRWVAEGRMDRAARPHLRPDECIIPAGEAGAGRCHCVRRDAAHLFAHPERASGA
jgi:hypothetical protein